MRKFSKLIIQNTQERLIELLNALKLSHNSIYVYQKKLTEDYAKNIFVRVENVACFKTKRKTLFESCVWLLASNNKIVVTNITSLSKPQLGVVDYNTILHSFYYDFVQQNIDETFNVNISGENVSMQDILNNEETYNLLDSWERNCNKEAPISHFIDYQNWMNFVVSAYRNRCELSSEDLSQWLIEDRHWPQMLNNIISELVSFYEYGIDLLNAEHNENR